MNSFEVDFNFGDKCEHHLVPWWNLDDNLPEKPGIYAWFMRLDKKNPEQSKALMDTIFRASSLHAEVKGVMNLLYRGELLKKSTDKEITNYDLFSDFLVMCSYPLYIGMSTNLRDRLKTHKRMIENISEDQYLSFLSNAESLSDSAEESRYFAARLMKSLGSYKIMGMNSLYVKYVCIDDSQISRGELLAVEAFGNTLFNPVFGRR